MNGLLSPFVTKEIQCPACKRYHAQRFFRQRAFMSGEKESDQHVLDYRWLNERLEQVHPPFYILFHCPNCKYTDTSEDFARPTNSEAIPMVLRHFERMDRDGCAVVNILASRVDYENIQFESAICLHFLALFIHALAPEDIRDHYKIARLYLRTAWLYRECGGGQVSSQTNAVNHERAEAQISSILQTTSEQESLLEQAEGVSAKMKQAIEERLVEMGRQSQSVNEYNYLTLCTQIELMQHRERELLGRIRKLCEQDATQLHLHGAEPSGSKEGADAESFADFLQRVKFLWPAAPLNEREAMEIAIAGFQKAISTDMRLSNHDTYTKIVLLNADLMVRCGNVAGALSMIGGIYKSAMDARSALQTQMRKADTSESDKRRIQGRMNRVGLTIEATSDFRRELLDLLLEQERPRIIAIMENNPGADVETLEEALLEGGVPRELARRIKESSGPLSDLRQSIRR